MTDPTPDAANVLTDAQRDAVRDLARQVVQEEVARLLRQMRAGRHG